MRRITFLIGNGFDINVGFPTRYSQFYEYYKKLYPNDMIAKEINSNYEYWADMEEGLGKFTAQIKPENEKEFWQSEELLEQVLADYLEKQTEVMSIDINETATVLKDSLTRFHDELSKEQKIDIHEKIRDIRDTITYSFISFNYTKVLDLCVEAGKEVFPKEIGNHRADNGITYSHTIGDVLHLHGTTKEELILGVNDITQISNISFRDNQLYRQFLIKEEANKRFRQNKIQDARQIIDTSAIICVFGASIGTTDKIWWSYICKWLQKSASNRLIIFAKNDKPFTRVTKYTLFEGEEKVLNKLKENSEVKNEEWVKVLNQIHIKFDSNIFKFNVKRSRSVD